MKTLIAVLILATAVAANLPYAYWTGKARYGTSVTGKTMVTCEYNYAGQYFWKSFQSSACPSSVEVQ